MSPKHANNFNLLRFFFASLVIVSHVPELIDGNRSHELLTIAFGTISFGELAVDSFFILSGYLITKSWVDRPDAIQFLVNRILRIFPGFLVASFICIFLIGPFYGTSKYFNDIPLFKAVTNLLFLNFNIKSGLVFEGSFYPVLNGSLWSIPFEFKCYLFILLTGLLGLLNKRFFMILVWLSCICIYIAIKSDFISAHYILLTRCLMTFSTGSLLYLFKQNVASSKWLVLVSFILLAVLLDKSVFAEPALCIFWGYAIIYFAEHAKFLLWFNKLPDISYGVYLYAWPINKIVICHYPGIDYFYCFVAVFFLSIICGLMSWYGCEKQALKLKSYFIYEANKMREKLKFA